MGSIIATLRDGEVLTLSADEDSSVMEILRDGGIDELLALCGGCCSCATCHIYVAPEWGPRLPEMSDSEDELLEGASERQAGSRLSCQIPYSANLDGLSITLAPEE